jgi:hypothetical protein
MREICTNPPAALGCSAGAGSPANMAVDPASRGRQISNQRVDCRVPDTSTLKSSSAYSGSREIGFRDASVLSFPTTWCTTARLRLTSSDSKSTSCHFKLRSPRHDSMTLAIAHIENEIAVFGCIREIRAPYSPENACAEFSSVLKSHRVMTNEPCSALRVRPKALSRFRG